MAEEAKYMGTTSPILLRAPYVISSAHIAYPPTRTLCHLHCSHSLSSYAHPMRSPVLDIAYPPTRALCHVRYSPTVFCSRRHAALCLLYTSDAADDM
eukprot:758795-Rhodomonas_salina.1